MPISRRCPMRLRSARWKRARSSAVSPSRCSVRFFPAVSPRDTMERLAALPFVELGREGLFIHDAVRSAVATSLAARDPDSHREYRRAAWTYLRDRSRPVYPADMWRHTADLLFLLENPVLREGFFP